MTNKSAAPEKHVLLTQPVPDAIDEILIREYQVHRLWQASEPHAMLAEIGGLIEGVVTGGAKGLSREIMAQLPALKIVAVSGIGTDAVDLAYAAERGIFVTTTPGVLTDDVADMALGLLIATLRQMSESERGSLAADYAAAGAQGHRDHHWHRWHGAGRTGDCQTRRRL